MSQQKQCPFCHRAIRIRDKFCPFCGRYVLETQPQADMYSRVTSPSQPPSQGYPAPSPTPQSPVPPNHPSHVSYTPPTDAMPPSPAGPPPEVPAPASPEETLSDDVVDQIALRVELEQLDTALADIRGKLEELGEMLSKVEVTDEIEQKIKAFKNRIKDIKAKRDNLNAEKRDLPFEADLTKKLEIQDRLKNLNEAYRSKKVTESAFKKLRDEYEQQLQDIDAKSRSFKAKINTWIKKLKIDREKTQETLEILEARFAAGEMTKDSFEETKTDYEEKINRFNNVLKFLSARL